MESSLARIGKLLVLKISFVCEADELRSQDAKNFWKALDHQGIALKANDKRFLTSKALVSEIESLKREQNQRATIDPRPQPAHRFQLTYDVSDRRALYDAARLVFSYLDRSHLVTFAEKPRVDAALRDILALSFAISPEEFSAELLAGTNDAEDMESNFDSASEAGGVLGTQSLDEAVEAALASSAGAGRKAKKGGDLRKKALRKTVPTEKRSRARVGANGGNSAPSSRGNSPAPSGTGGETDSVMNDTTPGPEGYEGGGEAMSREGSVDTSVAGGETGEASPIIDSNSFATSLDSRQNGAAGLADAGRPLENKPPALEERKTWNMFANSTLYALIRFFQVRLVPSSFRTRLS